MSVTYSAIVSNTNTITCLKILGLWHGSIYKNIIAEITILLILHLIYGSCFYFVFTPSKYPLFNQFLVILSTKVGEHIIYVPVAFVLGFYLSLVLGRWYEEVKLVPWIDEIAFLVNTFIESKDMRVVYLKRSIIRYLNASYVLAARSVLYDIYHQFPDKNHIIKAGILTEQEWVQLTQVRCRFNHYYVTTMWALNLAHSARDRGWIKSDHELDKLVTSICGFRGKVSTFFCIDLVNPPLAYTQIVGVALYCYVFGSLLSSIDLKLNDDSERSAIQVILGMFPPMQFLLYGFFIGWYKVAECLINPFGRSDFNFDAIYAVQRNLQAGFLIVDKYRNTVPPFEKTSEDSDTLSSDSQTVETTMAETMEYILSDERH